MSDVLDFSSDVKRKWFYILGSMLFLYFVFAPAANVLFHSGEDIRYVFGGPDKSCGSDDGFYFMKTLGRPLQAYMDCLSYKHGYTLERMRVIRLFAVGLMALGMGLLAEILYSMGLAFLPAFFAAGIMFMVPKLYGDTVQLGAVSLPYAVLFVMLSYSCLVKGHLIFANKTQGGPRLWLAFSAIWLFCALTTYPAMTFIFCTLMLMRVLFSKSSNWSQTKIEVNREIKLFISVCLVYFIWAYLNMRFNQQAPVPPAYRIDHPSINPVEIVQRTLSLLNPFDGAWWILPYVDSWAQGKAVIFTLCIGILFAGLGVWQNHKRSSQPVPLRQFIFYVALLYLFSCGFFLIIPVRDSIGSRLAFAAAASNVALIIWALDKFGVLFKKKIHTIASVLLLGSFLVIQAGQANVFTLTGALSHSHYLNNITSSIAGYLNTNGTVKRLHFVIDRGEYPYNNFFLASGAMSEIYGHDKFKLKWCSLPRGTEGDEKDHQVQMQACLQKIPHEVVAVTYSYKDEPYTQTDGMLVVTPKMEHVEVTNWYTHLFHRA